MKRLRLLHIDHVELFVPDRHEAARWYERVLGLEIGPEYEAWAADSAGPLMIANDDRSVKLALFEGKPRTTGGTAGFHRVAFRVSSVDFVAFVQRLSEGLARDTDQPVPPPRVADHQQAYSVYFSDPYGHHLEVTTYEHEPTRAALTRGRTTSR